jgi:hypothetical protein
VILLTDVIQVLDLPVVDPAKIPFVEYSNATEPFFIDVTFCKPLRFPKYLSLNGKRNLAIGLRSNAPSFF